MSQRKYSSANHEEKCCKVHKKVQSKLKKSRKHYDSFLVKVKDMDFLSTTLTDTKAVTVVGEGKWDSYSQDKARELSLSVGKYGSKEQQTAEEKIKELFLTLGTQKIGYDKWKNFHFQYKAGGFAVVFFFTVFCYKTDGTLKVGYNQISKRWDMAKQNLLSTLCSHDNPEFVGYMEYLCLTRLENFDQISMVGEFSKRVNVENLISDSMEKQKQNYNTMCRLYQLARDQNHIEQEKTDVLDGSGEVSLCEWDKYSEMQAKRLSFGDKESEDRLKNLLWGIKYANYGVSDIRKMHYVFKSGGSWTLRHARVYFSTDSVNEKITVAYASMRQVVTVTCKAQLNEDFWLGKNERVEGYMSYKCDQEIDASDFD